MEVESDVANWAQVFDKPDPKKQKYKQELTLNAEYQWCRVFVGNDLVKKKKLKAVIVFWSSKTFFKNSCHISIF